MPHFLKSGAGRTGIPQAIERNTCSASVKTAREQSEEVVGYSKMPNQSGCLVELVEVSQRVRFPITESKVSMPPIHRRWELLTLSVNMNMVDSRPSRQLR